MELHKKIFFPGVVLLSLFCRMAFGQGSGSTVHYSVGINAHYGHIIKHSLKLDDAVLTNPYGLDLNLNRLSTSYDNWKVFNTFWMSGLQAGYFNYRDPERLGGAFFLTAFAEPVLGFGRKYLFTLRAGAGISFHTRLYDSIENPMNRFFSTRVSFPVYLSARISYKLNSNTFINLSGNYNHISNGGVKQPNLGMNFPTLSLGLLAYKKPLPELHRNYTNDIAIKPGFTFLGQLLTGYRVVEGTEAYPSKGTFALGFHIRVSKQLSRYYALNTGAEMIMDGAIREIIRRDQSGRDYKRIAMTAGQDFLFGKAIFTQYLGFYLYSPYKARNSIYQKYELSYRLSPAIVSGFYLKAHLYVAELMGIHFSYLFSGKN